MERACLGATTLVELCRSVQAAIAEAVPADRWCGFAVDPSTLFATNGYHEEGVRQELVPKLLELEYGTFDSGQLPELVRSADGVSRLSEATGNDPARSARWRDVLVPSGLTHELRAVFRDGRNAWGALVLLRGPDVPDFSAEEAAFVSRVAPTVALGFRRVLVRQHVEHGEDAREAGVLVLSGDPPEIRTATNAARYWLEQLDDGVLGPTLPTVVVTAVRLARTRQVPTALRARTRSGRWLTITAERTLNGDGDGGAGDVGVVVQPSRPAEIAQIVAAAHGLTARETEVVLLLASGATNQEMARSLGVSPHTIADHLKRVYAKLDVVTRGELTSKLFYDYYLPRSSEGRPAGADGWFLPG